MIVTVSAAPLRMNNSIMLCSDSNEASSSRRRAHSQAGYGLTQFARAGKTRAPSRCVLSPSLAGSRTITLTGPVRFLVGEAVHGLARCAAASRQALESSVGLGSPLIPPDPHGLAWRHNRDGGRYPQPPGLGVPRAPRVTRAGSASGSRRSSPQALRPVVSGLGCLGARG
jgi:hypothetical protein